MGNHKETRRIEERKKPIRGLSGRSVAKHRGDRCARCLRPESTHRGLRRTSSDIQAKRAAAGNQLVFERSLVPCKILQRSRSCTTIIEPTAVEFRNANSEPGAVHVAGINATRNTWMGEGEEGSSSLDQGRRYQNDIESIPFTVDCLPARVDSPSGVGGSLVMAINVNDEGALERYNAQMEEIVRNRILQEAVQADVVSADSLHSTRKRSLILICIMIVLLAIIVTCLGVAMMLTLGPTSKDDVTNSAADQKERSINKEQQPTIELVLERGYLRCGTYDRNPSFAVLNEEGEMEGINIDQCGAVAIAVFGTRNSVQYVPVTSQNRLPMLANGSIDLLSSTTTHTMGRDVFDSPSNAGFTFSTPYLYSGMSFVGVPSFVDCAESLDSFYGTCRDLKVCAGLGTTHYALLLELLPGSAVVPVTRAITNTEFLIDGTCNVVAADSGTLPESIFRQQGYKGPFKPGQRLYSKEPLALVTRQNDSEWSGLVDLVVNIFFLAEANNITHAGAQDMGKLFAHDAEIAAIAVSVVSEFGNYAELYEKHLASVHQRGGLNSLYVPGHQTGLMYSFPFGYLNANGPGGIPSVTLQALRDRGHLLCGLIPRPGFAEFESDGTWSGFDVEFCRGVAAAAFYGKSEKVVFVNVTQHPYIALADGQADTVAGLRVTLQAKYKEPTTNKRYAFSPPTFYDDIAGDAYAFATKKEDQQWSDFVFWVISGIGFAEEAGITQNTSGQMPVTNLFGNELKQMFRDVVGEVGSYEEIYNRTLGELIPRGGGNLLNYNFSGPMQYAFPVS